jgi:hypothetical protein
MEEVSGHRGYALMPLGSLHAVHQMKAKEGRTERTRELTISGYLREFVHRPHPRLKAEVVGHSLG